MSAPLDEQTDQARPQARSSAPESATTKVPAATSGATAAYVWVGVGSSLGGVARYGAGLIIGAHLGEALPWGTILVNLTGSVLIGFFATLTGPEGRLYVPPLGRQFVMAGFCGGYTTFSSFSLQTLDLLLCGHQAGAVANISVSLVLCLAGAWIGHAAAAAINR